MEPPLGFEAARTVAEKGALKSSPRKRRRRRRSASKGNNQTDQRLFLPDQLLPLIKSEREVTTQQSVGGTSQPTNNSPDNGDAWSSAPKKSSRTRRRPRRRRRNRQDSSENDTVTRSGGRLLDTPPSSELISSKSHTNKVTRSERIVRNKESPPKIDRRRTRRGGKTDKRNLVRRKKEQEAASSLRSGPAVRNEGSTSPPLTFLALCPVKVELPSPSRSTKGESYSPPPILALPSHEPARAQEGTHDALYYSHQTLDFRSRSSSLSNSSVPSTYSHVSESKTPQIIPLEFPPILQAVTSAHLYPSDRQTDSRITTREYPNSDFNNLPSRSLNLSDSLMQSTNTHVSESRPMPLHFQPILQPVTKAVVYPSDHQLTSRDHPKSVFNRLDSPTKYRQTRLSFNRVAPPTTATNKDVVISSYDGLPQLAPHSNRLHHLEEQSKHSRLHMSDGLFDRLGPSRKLPASSSLQDDVNHFSLHNSIIPNLEPESDLRESYRHSRDEGTSGRSCMFSKPIPDGVVKIEPSMSSCATPDSQFLYRTKAPAGLDVTKVLKRYVPKSYHSESNELSPSTVCTSSRSVSDGNRFLPIKSRSPTPVKRVVDFADSPVQFERPCSSRMPISLRQTPPPPLSHDVDDSRDGGYSNRYDRSHASRIHIPLSRKGLKVVAIDCEMVGCIKKNQVQPEQIFAGSLMQRLRGSSLGSHLVKRNEVGGGVLFKTRMKHQAPPRKQIKQVKPKELSIAARCSIVSYDGSVLYDKYIDPSVGTDYKIIAFRTPWSGITSRHMVGATPFRVAREEILNILSGCIVIGHNISSDLRSLEIDRFPPSQIRDTSFHPTLKARTGLPNNKQPGALKKMSSALLGRSIQTKSRVGHCSVEDATATMDLYKLVELEWEV